VELINVTRMEAGYTSGLDVTGREHLVVVVKGTFVLPRTPNDPVVLHEEQFPLALTDTFTGEPGLTAVIRESDYAITKPACDVLLVGSAHASEGRPTRKLQVGLRVGTVAKSFQVNGDRHWVASPVRVRASDPEPFVTKPISYDFAFGGVDNSDLDAIAAFDPNPVGRGFSKHRKASWLDGRPLPNTEETTRPVTQPDGDYRPMAFGVIGRGWSQRRALAGTYDEEWLNSVFPFLPRDFSERYFQAAPADQQLAVPEAPLEVTLLNLTPEGRTSFVLPVFSAPIHVFPKRAPREEHRARMDTLVFEPDAGRFTISWRLCRPLKRDLFDIAQVQVGGKGREWWLMRADTVAAASNTALEEAH